MKRVPFAAVVMLSLVLAVGTALASDMVGGAPLVAALSGAAEVPGPGDPDGYGMARVTVNPGQGQVCWELWVSEIAPATAAHIHRGAAGSSGPVVVGLSAPTGGHSSGCKTIERSLAQELVRHPDSFYVNVHNAAHPPGALRGNLSRPGGGTE